MYYELPLALKIDPKTILAWPLNKINGWRAYFDLQPFGFYRDEYLNSQICATIRDMSGKSYNDKPAPKAQDLMVFTNTMRELSKPHKPLLSNLDEYLEKQKNGG